MKYLCDNCERLVELVDYELHSGALNARCDKCGATSRAASRNVAAASGGAIPCTPSAPSGAPANEASRDPSAIGGGVARSGTFRVMTSADSGRSIATGELPANVMPLRSGDVQSELLGPPEGFCPKCIAPRAGDSTACPQCGLVYANFQPEEVSPSPELSTGWSTLSQQWDDTTRHDAFVALAMKLGELATAGRLYRIRVARTPTDLLAQRGRDEVVRLALLPSLRAPDAIAPDTVKKAKLIAILIFFGVSFLCLLLLFRQLVK
ncbi:MAG: hypothetical protein ACT4TC_02985 [Myxococcaceae bacterium]